jgi:hypothetical protein
MNTRSNTFSDTSPDTSLEPSGEFASALSNFRSAVNHVAERETAKPVPYNWLFAARRRHKSTQRRLILAWTCAALLCIGAMPLLHQTTPAVAPRVVELPKDSGDDTALLEQVDSAVSESVPSSLAPLASLDSWSSSPSTNEVTTESSLNKPEKKNVAR